MMKKLAVLFLVLATGGLVSAGLSLEVINDEVAIVLDAGSVNLVSYYLEVSIDAGAFDSAAVNVNPSGKGWMTAAKKVQDLAQLYSVTAADIKMFGGQGLAAPNMVMTGLKVTGADEYTVTLSSKDCVWFNDVNEKGVLASVFVPEPMSMLLLGVGGLFLRRRK